jgi:hypothetical protein
MRTLWLAPEVIPSIAQILFTRIQKLALVQNPATAQVLLIQLLMLA